VPGGLSWRDLEDADIVDARELESDGSATYNYLTGVTIVSTTSSTKQVVVSGIDIIHDDEIVEEDDIFILSGSTGGADGTYTVDSVVDETTFTVVESIADSTGGTGIFRFPPGAIRIGVDPTSIVQSSQSLLQGVLEDLDAAISGGGITPAQHKALRHLIHFIDEGPADGFASGAYRQVVGSKVFPTSIIWWESSAMSQKIVEKIITRTGTGTKVKPTPITWKMYDTDGTTVLATVMDDIQWSGPFEIARVRTIVAGNLIALRSNEIVEAVDGVTVVHV
jgi:hypothetical protein